MEMRRRRQLPGADRDDVQARLDRPRRVRQVDPALLLQLVDVDDVLRPLGRLTDFRLPGRRLPLPRPPACAGLDPGREEPGDPRPRQVRRHELGLPAVGEHIEPVLAGAQRVLLRVRTVDDAIAFANLVHLAVLPREARSAQDEEDLLVLDVRRRRPFPRIDLDPVHGHRDAPRGAAELPPAPGEVTLLRSTRTPSSTRYWPSPISRTITARSPSAARRPRPRPSAAPARRPPAGRRRPEPARGRAPSGRRR